METEEIENKKAETIITHGNMELLTAQDIASQMQISEAKAYLLMQRKQIPIVKIGRAVRVRPIDLDRFILQSLVG
jgi:excisionase family DNA binding protein